MTAKLNANGRYQNLHPANKCYTREHHSVPLNKQANRRLNTSLQNVSSLALYSVAAMAAPAFSHPAWAKSSVQTTYQPDTIVPSAIAASETQVESSAPSTPNPQTVTSPETIIVQEFAPEAVVKPVVRQVHQSDRDGEMVSSDLESLQPIVPRGVSGRQTPDNRQFRVDKDARDEPHVKTFAIDRESQGNQDERQNRQSVANSPKQPCRATQPMILAQAPNPTQPAPCRDVNRLQEELRSLEDIDTQKPLRASPALSIVIPTAYGAHRNTGFVSATYQERTRYSDVDDGALGIGIGLGDAEKSVGVELSYALASFGSSRDFGSGGFNAKVHRRLPQGWAVAAGWNGLINLGDDNDFEHSVYGVVSKIIRTREDINQPFSRVAITAGIGNGQFRTEEAVEDDNGTINVFGNVAVRVAEPVSLIAEWTGQDLGVGVSIAPFKNIPLVITPALRDIAGAGDGARFVLGAGLGFKF
ncbi:MAG: hypothetical protein RIG63_28820 [Coleofasciculus chthonoplastes F3-SA18-01]|uniref:hypothetical protein n=1 Tax=Coleofasciculus chthonoplastes TaxID=64178 RepID=UPI003300C899